MGNANLGDQSNSAPLPGGAIQNASVSGAELAANAVTTAKIAANAITAEKIAANTITVNELAAALQQVLVPVGSILAFGGTTAPTGWLLCNGDPYDPSVYPNLYATIGNAYGGTTTAPLRPDFRGRVPYGMTSAGVLSNRLNNDGVAEASRTPQHSHGHTLTLPNHGHTHNIAVLSQDHGHTHSLAVNSHGHSAEGHVHGTADNGSRAGAFAAGTLAYAAAFAHNHGNTGGPSTFNAETPGVNGSIGGGAHWTGIYKNTAGAAYEGVTNPTSNPAINGSVSTSTTVPYGVANYIIKA